MTPNDLKQLETSLIPLLKQWNISSILCLSPSYEEFQLIKEMSHEMSHRSQKILSLNYSVRTDWDLNTVSKQYADLIIACNVMMYSNNPKLWFDNIMKSCHTFLCQDVISRQRSDNSEFGQDGDSMRFRFDGDGDWHVGRDVNAFDVSSLPYKLSNLRIYDGTPNIFCPNPVHFIVELRNG